MATTIFRMRSIDALIGDRQELASQTIYFSATEELNDPLEGFRSYFWRGDDIIWTNLFRNYLFCLHRTMCMVKLIGDTMKIETQMIPLNDYAGHQSNRSEYEILERIFTKVFGRAKLDVLIRSLSDSDRKIYRFELLYYLRTLHYIALPLIQNIHVDSGLSPENEAMSIPSEPPDLFYSLPDLMAQATKETEATGHDIASILFGTIHRISENRAFSHKFLSSSTNERNSNILPSNRQFVILDFPNLYLEELEKLGFPKCYVACFMDNYRNSSLWGHYADGHKGACLMFQTEARSEEIGLTLTKITGISGGRRTEDGRTESKEIWNPSWMRLYPILYRKKIPSIDFFESIGELPKPMLLHNWYTNREGTRSRCGAHLEPNNEEEWRDDYWNEFVRGVTLKTTDWKYEGEYRLILHSIIVDLDEQRKRTLTYNFDALSGIIFGMKSSDAEKLKVINIINEKRANWKNHKFQFYQAYFDHESNRIEKQEIDVARATK